MFARLYALSLLFSGKKYAHTQGGGNALMHELFYFFSCYFLSFLWVSTGLVKASPANVAGILLFGHELSISVEIT